MIKYFTFFLFICFISIVYGEIGYLSNDDDEKRYLYHHYADGETEKTKRQLYNKYTREEYDIIRAGPLCGSNDYDYVNMLLRHCQSDCSYCEIDLVYIELGKNHKCIALTWELLVDI